MKKVIRRYQSGFTLIEVAVALAILGWVLGGAMYMLSHYADERSFLRDRFLANQVAWNRLLEQYRSARGWMPDVAAETLVSKGVETQDGSDWRWEMTVEPAAGRDLFRYQTVVGAQNGERSTASLAIFLIRENAE